MFFTVSGHEQHTYLFRRRKSSTFSQGRSASRIVTHCPALLIRLLSRRSYSASNSRHGTMTRISGVARTRFISARSAARRSLRKSITSDRASSWSMRSVTGPAAAILSRRMGSGSGTCSHSSIPESDPINLSRKGVRLERENGAALGSQFCSQASKECRLAASRGSQQGNKSGFVAGEGGPNLVELRAREPVTLDLLRPVEERRRRSSQQ